MSLSMLEKAKTLEPKNPNKSTGDFGGKSSGILNWNDIAYPHWYKMYKRLICNYWQADEVNMASDVKQFPELTENEQDAYFINIGRSTNENGTVAFTLCDRSICPIDNVSHCSAGSGT